MSPALGSNLALRIGTALVGVPALLGLLFWAPVWAWLAASAILLLLGLGELERLLASREIRILRVPALVLSVALFLDASHSLVLPSPLWPLGVFALLASVVANRRDRDRVVPAAAATLLACVYVAGLGGTVAGLRVLEPRGEGAWRVVLLCAIVMGSDTCAYFVGHAIGRHRLAPRISPGKTVEGGVGGLLGGVVGAGIVWHLGLGSVPLPHVLTLGAVTAAAGVMGDLFESLLKRWAGIKDSGTLLPGHGGILDRIDGLLFGAPVLYYYFTWY